MVTAQLNHGFESASGFWEAFKVCIRRAAEQVRERNVPASEVDRDTPLGTMLALADEDGLHLLEFVDRRGLENELLALRKRTKCVVVPGNGIGRILEAIAAELKRYFQGTGADFSVPLVLGGASVRESRPGGTADNPPRKNALLRRDGRGWASRSIEGRGARQQAQYPALGRPLPPRHPRRRDALRLRGGVLEKWLLEHERRSKTSIRPFEPEYSVQYWQEGVIP